MRSIKPESSRISVAELTKTLPPAGFAARPSGTLPAVATKSAAKPVRLTESTAPYLIGYRFEPAKQKYMREEAERIKSPSGHTVVVTTHNYYTLEEALDRPDPIAQAPTHTSPMAIAAQKMAAKTPVMPAAAPAMPRAHISATQPPRLTEATAPRLEGFSFLPYANKYERELTKYVALPDGRKIPVTTHKEFTLEEALDYMDRKAAERNKSR